MLLVSHTTLAEQLYRWVEPDGSITFSPKPPPAGTDYTAVSSASGNPAGAQWPADGQKPSILATSEHGLDLPKQAINKPETVPQPTPAAARQKLTYAPDTGVQQNKPITAANAAPLQKKPVVSGTKLIASSKKRRQCEDLSKRVLSLERRLRSPLEPVDMDNTVVAMARYQRSLKLHCIE